MGIVVDKIPVYKRIGGVFVKVEEWSEEDLEYLMEPDVEEIEAVYIEEVCLLYTSPSPRDRG